MRVLAASLLLLLTLALVVPSFAQKARYVSERKERLSDPITNMADLALKIGFHSGCSGCLASGYNLNWCVHPDNDGVGACVPGDCSGYNYNTIFGIEGPAKKRVLSTTTSFKDGSYICNSDREPEFRVQGKSRISYGVQGTNPGEIAGPEDYEYSALSDMFDGVFYSDVDTFSQAVFPNFCNIAENTIIDRTQGGPDFLINAGYEHCLMANSELRPILDRECGPESRCFEGFGNNKRFFQGDSLKTESLRRQLQFFLNETPRFFYYQCVQHVMESQEQRDHYNWIIAAIRSVSCANDCHPSGVPVSGVCQHSCTRINDAFLNYVRSYQLDLQFLDPVLSQFEIFGNSFEDLVVEWALGKYVCVPDDTPLCQHVDLKDTVTGYFHSRISPETMTYEEQQYCEELVSFFEQK